MHGLLVPETVTVVGFRDVDGTLVVGTVTVVGFRVVDVILGFSVKKTMLS